MKYLIGISFAIILLLPCNVDAENYWQRLKTKADKLYDGWDISITVNTGFEHREYFRGARTGPYGNVEVSVPLYSRKERLAMAKGRMKFLEKGAKYIKAIEERRARVEILQEKAKVLRAIMVDEGAIGIKAYYDVVKEIAQCEADIKEAKRKIEAMLRN